MTNSNKKTSEAVHQPKNKIAIIGAAETGHCGKQTLAQAENIGKMMAEKGIVLVTGVTTGVPYWAAKGAKQAGGMVIGLSPAESKTDHLNTYNLPVDYHDIIIYTGLDYSGRNMLISRSADGLIAICGRMGTLNAFTIAFEDQKPIGVLGESGGTSSMMGDIIEKAHKGPGKVVFETDPKTLFEKVVEMCREEK